MWMLGSVIFCTGSKHSKWLLCIAKISHHFFLKEVHCRASQFLCRTNTIGEIFSTEQGSLSFDDLTYWSNLMMFVKLSGWRNNLGSQSETSSGGNSVNYVQRSFKIFHQRCWVWGRKNWFWRFGKFSRKFYFVSIFSKLNYLIHILCTYHLRANDIEISSIWWTSEEKHLSGIL